MEEAAILEDVVAEVMVITKNQGDGQTGATTTQHGRGNGQTSNGAHCYAFPGRSEGETSDAVITGIF